jgi:hypothetical protein
VRVIALFFAGEFEAVTGFALEQSDRTKMGTSNKSRDTALNELFIAFPSCKHPTVLPSVPLA